jgi:hypothetical protein
VTDIDTWIESLANAGHYVSCSSGTTGKCSIIPASMGDRTFTTRNLPASMTWATGIPPVRDYKIFILATVAKSFRAEDGKVGFANSFAKSQHPFPGEPITVGGISRMVILRRSIADGTAQPADIAAFEETSAKRAKALEASIQSHAKEIVASRGEKLSFHGQWATMFQIAKLVREMGYSGKDFNPENSLMSAGGLKGAKLPADYREQIFETFNVRPEYAFQLYSMQEMNSTMPCCKAGRYHIPPWVIPLILDQTGDQLLSTGKGEVEGRAAFFDMSLDGRWCGVISGDKVRVDFGKCACGHHGPTVDPEIVRYSELPGGDKISCAGTIDAYIRGAA